MAITKHHGIKIQGIVNVIPEQLEDNLHLTLLEESDRQKLIDYTGIRYRRISRLPVKSLFARGIEELLKLTEWRQEDIDILICVTQTHETSIPSIACQLHGELNFTQQTMCYDINSGCSGYVYGLQTIASILATVNKEGARALFCCGDVSTHLLSESDTSTQPIFSDAISVTAVEYESKNNDITAYFNLETIGKGQTAIYSEINNENKKIMRLNGIDVFAYSVKYVPQNIQALIETAKISNESINAYIFHQANKLINDAIVRKLNLNSELVPQTLSIYGNTASASIPITLCTNLEKIHNWVILSGFGVGFSVASAAIKLPKLLKCKTIEI
jgi:3-oxoacyl-[acyl-carrier-protein] synthase-3